MARNIPGRDTIVKTVSDRQIVGNRPDGVTASGGGSPTGGSTPTGPAGGDLAGSYPNPTLKNTGPGALTKGSATRSPTVTIDAQGRVTALSDSLIAAAGAISVRTRADLRAYVGAVDKQFIVEEGYGFEGDGGGGIWFFVSADNYSIDNDGTLIVPGGSYGTHATVGCWHRVGPGTQGNSVLTSTTLDIRWFGALPNDVDISVAIGHAFAALTAIVGAQQVGCLYAPAGEYRIENKIVMAGGGLGFTMKGDGPGATNFLYGMTGADTCAWEISGVTTGSFQDCSFKWINFPTTNNPSVLWVHDCTYFNLCNIQGLNLVSTDLTGGVVRCTANTNLTMLGLTFGGNGSGGTQLFWESGSGLMTACNFLTATTDAPCWRVGSCNSYQVRNCFFQGGGPWKSFAGATITSTASDFTVNATSHGFVAGDYILLRGAAHAAYNTWWRVASVTTNTLTVTTTINPGADTATLSTLWSCAYFGTTGGNVTESFIGDCLFNTGGGPGVGSVGLYLDAFRANHIGELTVSHSLFDYGYCSIFAHGLTNSDPGSTCGALTISACRPNGGPRDAFGCVRLEGVNIVTIDGFRSFPGGPGTVFNTFVICDGGQANPTQDISITGGVASNKNSSALYPGTTICAFTFDGTNVKNVCVANVAVDASKTVAQFLNGASAANGLTVMYGDNAGRVTLIDSTGTHNL